MAIKIWMARPPRFLIRHNFLRNPKTYGPELELVSKELNHFWAIASFFQGWASGTLTVDTFVYVTHVSVPGVQSRKKQCDPPKVI